MGDLYKVQEGVKMPDIDRAPKNPRRKYPIEGMKLGAMFFVPGRSCRSVCAYIARIAANKPEKFSSRACHMRVVQGENVSEGLSGVKYELCEPGDPGAMEGTGVWRTV